MLILGVLRTFKNSLITTKSSARLKLFGNMLEITCRYFEFCEKSKVPFLYGPSPNHHLGTASAFFPLDRDSKIRSELHRFKVKTQIKFLNIFEYRLLDESQIGAFSARNCTYVQSSFSHVVERLKIFPKIPRLPAPVGISEVLSRLTWALCW